MLSTDSGYDGEVENQKLSRNAGLYITVNPSSGARVGKKPNRENVTIAARQFRAYKADGTEVTLPGSTMSTAGRVHLVPGGRPIIQIKPAQMTDMRRFTNFNYNANRSVSNPYDPKQIDIIEVDMTALKMAVDWTVNGSASSQIYNYESSSSDSTYRSNSQSTVALTAAYSISGFNSSDWNGMIYVESVDAETRRDSGVRLINGRGRVASTATGSANEGLSIATNDALYVLGHFNADGNIDTNVASLTNSSRYPENANEIPASIAADAVTILSQPLFNVSTGQQTDGWNDALSAHRHITSNYSSSWATSNPSNSNYRDGISTVITAGQYPTSSSSAGYGNSFNRKMNGASTEVSAALLAGVVPSNKNNSSQMSGGAHNFPRLLEYWDGVLAIRGSMVALFESRVANEPWGIRYYNAPDRFWGFNELLAAGRYPPKTPRVRTYRRVDFTDLDPSEYTALLESLPW